MASGNPVVQILEVMLPGSTFPELKTRTGGSTPAERVIIHSFDAATAEYLDFKCLLLGYGGGGLTFT